LGSLVNGILNQHDIRLFNNISSPLRVRNTFEAFKGLIFN